MTDIVGALPSVTAAQRATIQAAPLHADAHKALAADMPALDCLEAGGAARRDALPARFRVAAWNVERCLFPEASAALLAPHGPDVVLLSEMDSGMARTGQRNTTAAMADAMGMTYAYGVEFYEMGLGSPTEAQFCKDDFNAEGWHGNSILSSAPFERLALIRMELDGHWFAGSAADPEQRRVGGRMAVAAVIRTEAGPACFVSVHLESDADAAYRHRQFEGLFDRIEAFAPGLPVLIGGDLNTGNRMPPDYDWRSETLFDLARARGYDWDLTADGMTTRPSLITTEPMGQKKLDWFAARGLGGKALPTLPALAPDGRPLSDHECMLCEVDMADAPAKP